MSDTRQTVVPAETERYTEQQLVEILRRAAERQEGLTTEPDGRFSLEEIQQIASEVGIAPAHIAAAAAGLNEAAQPPISSFLGAPTAFRFERWIDGEIPRSGIGPLFDIVRREFGSQGQVSEALDTVEWRARAGLGATVVSVTRRSGRTQISVDVTRGEAAALVATTTSVAGAAGAAAIGSAFAATALSVGPIAVAGVIVVSLGWGGAGAWAAMSAIWRRAARRWPARVDALGQALVVAAQHAIDEARKDNG
jgi:hypothetical protein